MGPVGARAIPVYSKKTNIFIINISDIVDPNEYMSTVWDFVLW